MTHPCSQCGSTRAGKRWFVSWHNNANLVTKVYCPKCKRLYAPPLHEVKRVGGTVRVELEHADDDAR